MPSPLDNDLHETQTPTSPDRVHSSTQHARSDAVVLCETNAYNHQSRPTYAELGAFSRSQAFAQLHRGDSQITHVYVRTLACGRGNDEGIFYHCRSRSCDLCSRRRQGQVIGLYRDWVTSWGDPCLLTLTRKSVPRERIGSEIEHQKQELSLIKRKLVEREQTPVRALRKVEVDYNTDSGLYHPHLHILVDGSAVAKQVRDEWLSRHRETASEGGQHVLSLVPAEALNGLAYIAKPIVQLRSVPGKAAPSLEAINAIHEALRGTRVLQAYGRPRALIQTQ